MPSSDSGKESPRRQTPRSIRGESSFELLIRARTGDIPALNALYERYLPLLRRWATGRLPSSARQLLETEDLVQETMLRTLDHLDHFERRGDGALLAYMRQGLLNRIRDEIRRVARHPGFEESPVELQDHSPSPLEEAIGKEAVHQYESALEHLKPAEKEAVILRLEMGLSYKEIADAIGKPSANSARMTVSRALVKLASRMSPETGTTGVD